MPEPAASPTADERTVSVVGGATTTAVPDTALLQLGSRRGAPPLGRPWTPLPARSTRGCWRSEPDDRPFDAGRGVAFWDAMSTNTPPQPLTCTNRGRCYLLVLLSRPYGDGRNSSPTHICW